jgi:hypothetical protein
VPSQTSPGSILPSPQPVLAGDSLHEHTQRKKSHARVICRGYRNYIQRFFFITATIPPEIAITMNQKNA